MINIIHICFGMYFASVVHGDICCVPQKWESFEYGKGNLLRPLSGEVDKVSYDADSKKIAIAGVYLTDGIKTEFKVIFDHSNSTRYLIQPVNEVCVTATISSEFPKLCVPDDAHGGRTSYLGVGEKKLNVAAYGFRITRGLLDVKMFFVVTESGCIPISSDIRGTYNNTKVVEILNYFKVTSGISNDTVFNPPDYCNGAILNDESPLGNSFLMF